MVADIPENIERWTAKRRVALVVSLLKGETSVAEAARKHALTVAEVEAWRDRFLLGAENALRSRPGRGLTESRASPPRPDGILRRDCADRVHLAS